MLKIAIAQLNPTIGFLSKNAENILEAAKVAEKEGVRLLLTPELSLCGYPPRDLLFNPGFIDKTSQQLAALAQKLPPAVAVLVGTLDVNHNAAAKGEKPLYNSIALLEGGQVQKIFHKRLLPTYDVFDEDRYFESGRQSNFFSLDVQVAARSYIKIGVTVCEDLWNDEGFWGQRNYEANPIQDLVTQGVDLIVNLSASPYSVHKQQLREAMLGYSATRYRVPIIYANQVGGNDDLIFDGSSFAIARTGQTIARMQAFKTDFAILEYNLEKRDLKETALLPLIESENEEIWQALVLGVRDYTHKCGFSKVVLGLSGGIDSALVAAIAAAALGKENVLGVIMPSPYSSEHSISDAIALARNLGIQTQKLPIADLMKAYDLGLETLFAETEFGIAEENLQSRIRGNILMAIANKFNYLLLSTGNKSEIAVGYCTLYGDMNGGLAVIADVPKTRVYSLCRWLNRRGETIPAHILSKPPSAELKPGQLDRDSLPPYEVLDDILERMLHRHEGSDRIIAAGADPETVNKVAHLVARAEFKRRQAPPGLKITDRAFGTGWRMPIACRFS
ncbi:NAD+ synthase [Oscillatoria sp. FACHB-1406]|uniref:NAD+ synthase n=1 Tax=Oscillatoria sp. FACHB-1406 TaxID=2692846 RepID=UPI0016824102|nr:NAD+ synthase [Oscillatoria sp. FACHB-1406]MBD2576666.1 NAD+ synthase [Oscillatoria sp. FACHB-1406]